MDKFDLINLVIISVIILWFLIINPKERLSALIFLLLFFLIALNASNRIIGYPDKKWATFEFSLYLLYPILTFLIVLQLKAFTLWKKFVIFTLILLNAYYPVCLLPIAIIRNSWANSSTQYVIPKWRPASFITKVTRDTLFVVQMIQDKNGQKRPHVISYYWNRKNSPAFSTDTEILSGGGSMEAQKLNQPYAFILKLITLF